MPLTAPLRRAAAWIALVAMLAFALLPTLSRAMATAGGWAEVCTPTGMKWVSVAPDGGAPDAPMAVSLDHCALCSLATEGAAPLPAAPVLPLAVAPGSEAPQAWLHAACTAHAWRSAQPRGPPAAA